MLDFQRIQPRSANNQRTVKSSGENYGTMPKAPQPSDSDTDSGICVDFDQAHSKLKQFRNGYGLNYSQQIISKHTPSNVGSIRQSALRRQNDTDRAAGSTSKNYHVRFADQISPNESLSEDQIHDSSCCSYHPFEMTNKPIYMNYLKSDDCYNRRAFVQNNFALASAPTSDNTSMERCNFTPRHNATKFFDRNGKSTDRFNHRSSSLPRRIYLNNFDPENDNFYQPKESFYEQLIHMNNKNNNCVHDVPRSENVRWYTSPMVNGWCNNMARQLPKLPIDAEMPRDNNQANFIRNMRNVKRLKRNKLSQPHTLRSRSIGPLIRQCSREELTRNEDFDSCTYWQTPAIRISVISIDCYGSSTIRITKLKSGPFGFYIANGTKNNKQGIFISRITIPSLTSVLSVGDEIIYLENELVKGRNVEYVQMLIAGKVSVKIMLTPINSS